MGDVEGLDISAKVKVRVRDLAVILLWCGYRPEVAGLD